VKKVRKQKSKKSGSIPKPGDWRSKSARHSQTRGIQNSQLNFFAIWFSPIAETPVCSSEMMATIVTRHLQVKSDPSLKQNNQDRHQIHQKGSSHSFLNGRTTLND
jgi:hypothetical protein